MVKEYEPDLAIAPLVITTSAVDAHVAIPQNLPGSIPRTHEIRAPFTTSTWTEILLR